MPDSPIPLSELIAALRSELAGAQTEGEGHQPRFLVEETDVELQMVVGRELAAGGGVKFWVYNAEAKGKLTDETVQTIRLKLKPISPEGSDFKMGTKQEIRKKP